ncbi:MAG TPA: hypothetical protein VD884_14805 [Ohtaekwangia sp.]|nr:hypothetical protein [Ohtaekwangia sp.]
MYKVLISILCSTLCQFSLAQDAAELEKRHGFKDIKLEANIDSVQGVKLKKEFKENDEFDAKLYTIDHPDYEKIGDVKIKEVEVKAYKNLIYEISVIADKDPRLMKALESLFGKADYDIKNETYFWKAENLVLKFRQHGKHHIEMLYFSYVIPKMMKEDKKQKIENIANDF